MRFIMLVLAVATMASAAFAAAPPAGGIVLQGVRTWSAPTHTRLVFDFSSQVTPVVPDSGETRELVIAIPGERVKLGEGATYVTRIADGVIDSVQVAIASDGARVHLRFPGTRTFRTFPLVAEEDKPFRLVVDVDKPGAQAAEAQRLATIAETKRTDRIRIVAVDAGHGGEDTGARGPGGVREKDVVLAIAQATVRELNRIPGIKGVLTRSGDYFIPLRQRYALAERMKADVFISIHANSSARRGAGNGTEVYFLSLGGASDQALQDLADLENAADRIGGVPAQAENDLVNILYDVKRSGALKQSELLAETLLQQVVSGDRRLAVRGVKQAGFVVLKSVEFPSSLVEVAFINNPREALLLKDPGFQQETGAKIAAGVKQYFERAGIGLGAATGAGAAGSSAAR